MNKTAHIIISIVVLVALVIILVVATGNKEGAKKANEFDAFAQCINDSGATFYGAFWCPHCQAQKAMFKQSSKYLPYVECSTPNRQGQTQVCIDAEIGSYPTWEFADGSRLSGEVPLDILAEKTSCALPGTEPTEVTPEPSATPETE